MEYHLAGRRVTRDMYDWVMGEKRKGARVTLVVPEEEAHDQGCPNCANGRLYVALVVGGPFDSAPPFTKQQVPWVKRGEGNSKGETPVMATLDDDGRWYQRITRAFRCPLCQVNIADAVPEWGNYTDDDDDVIASDLAGRIS